MSYNHLFGPVPSRRLGRSLGVDLVPMKTCSLDCVYCECGETTDITINRKEYEPVQSVIAELEHCLSAAPNLDFITFSGSGEPTLNSNIGRVVSFLKTNYSHYKLCLLTNGTLFSDQSLLTEVSNIDLLIPSLDAASEQAFQSINRPHASLSISAVIDGLIDLRSVYKGEIILEVFIVPGLNDTSEELALLKDAISRIKPDRVQVGTLDRPGTEEWVKEAETHNMRKIAGYLGKAELIGEYRPRRKALPSDNILGSQIIQTLQRRPCTLKDLQQALSLRPVEIQKQIRSLLEEGNIVAEERGRGIFFRVNK